MSVLTACYLALAGLLTVAGTPAHLALAALVVGYLALRTWARHHLTPSAGLPETS